MGKIEENNKLFCQDFCKIFYSNQMAKIIQKRKLSVITIHIKRGRMVIMNYFVSFCSVRLGSIVTGVLSMIQAIVFLVISFLVEVETLKSNAYEQERDQAEKGKTDVFDMIITSLKKSSEEIQIFLAAFFSLYMVTCIMEMIGAFKLMKWLLLPFIIMDAARILLIFCIHVLAMIMFKTKMNLGELITASVAGGFTVLLLGYLWSCVVSLFQILNIIKTDRYQALYGHLSTSDYYQGDAMVVTKFSVKPVEQTLKINVIDNNNLYPIKDLSKSQKKKNFIQNNNLNSNYNTSSNYISNYQYSNYTDGYYNEYARK